MEQLEKTSTLVYKHCSHCKQVKPIAEFGGNKTRKDGLHHACRVCESQRLFEYNVLHRGERCRYYIEHRERLLENNREWRNSFDYKQYRREYYHRIQDEANCHSMPRDFYPGYRIIKALENAEVVELKV